MDPGSGKFKAVATFLYTFLALCVCENNILSSPFSLSFQAVALWVNFMGFTDGREPLIFYILASWGLPIIIVVITILIWQFGVNRPLTELYGQRYTGEMYVKCVTMC